MPPPPPTLPDELVEEIYLRLPPDEPACLVRASLASKLWLDILTGPRFTARYRDFHGAPPMLGFCPVVDSDGQELDPAKPYFSTTRFGPRIPEDKGWGSSEYSVHDCRHGRILLERARHKPTPTPFVLWDPMTGCRREMRAEVCLRNYPAAVLCAVTGCDHRACHKGPSLVVSVGVEDENSYAASIEFFVRTWSSQTGQWSDPCYCPDLPLCSSVLGTVLIGDALFYMIHYPGENEENFHEILIGFVIYQLGSSSLSVLHAPPLPGYVDVFNRNYIHMAMEDGTLGFARVDNSALYLCSRRTGSDADEPWTQHAVIHLDKLLPIQHPEEPLELVGSVEGRDIIFVAADIDIYEIDLKSLKCKKLCKKDNLHALIPYMSFYHPRDGHAGATDPANLADDAAPTAVKRGRGRPRKKKRAADIKKGGGRPRKDLSSGTGFGEAAGEALFRDMAEAIEGAALGDRKETRAADA